MALPGSLMAQINLLQNGSFAGNYVTYREQPTMQTPFGWAPWWIPQRSTQPLWQNLTPTYGPYPLDGRLVQQVDSPWGTHQGGLFQQVPAAAGNLYELSIEAMAWSSEDETPGSKAEPSDVNVQIGVDPTGGLDPASPLIIWHEPMQPLSKWRTLEMEFEAETNVITIYLKSAPALPKRQQCVFWRNARLTPIGSYRRGITIVGQGDTYLRFQPEEPQPGDDVEITVSSIREQVYAGIWVLRPEKVWENLPLLAARREQERHTWQYRLRVDEAGLYDVRFVGDQGARLLAQQLLRIEPPDPLEVAAQQAPRGEPRVSYRRVYVLLPPTADGTWLAAAARGSFDGRYTVGFSADDAGIGNLPDRHVLAINPHHWPEMLTATWFHQHYPGTRFIPIVVNSPTDLEAWLRNWLPPQD
ncbi:MAG: hypothetical protein KC418_21375 [Anaerolineales bacterium]|nr:hypothetical protein [Anaerolineales bacterium]MCB8952265.1 hypothetical protein [Ardenticatenales bacterium]